MAQLTIACLSQKGGVGKSTLARLVAVAYATGDWSVKICDFNTKQLTSVDWVGTRLAQGIEPVVHAEPYNNVKNFKRETANLLVVDGKPDSDVTSLEIARAADLCIIPTGTTIDDLKPQVMFCNELVSKGVQRDRIMIVLNKTGESQLSVAGAREYLAATGYQVAETDLTAKIGYQYAQNSGRSIMETEYQTLNDRAFRLAKEVVDRVKTIQARSAA